MNWTQLLRSDLSQLQPYESARSLFSGEEIDLAFLDANEVSGADSTPWNRYPSPQPPALRQQMAGLYSVSPEQVLLTRGADEAIDLVVRGLSEAKSDAVLAFPPTYGMYEVSTKLQGSRFLRAPLLENNGGWEPNWELLSRTLASEKSLKIIFICNPNNPTGHLWREADIKRVCESAPRSLVVVDEAYGEFSPQASVTNLLGQVPNLAALKTLSKAWALAGLRFGCLLGPAGLIAALQKVRAPYPLPTPICDLVTLAISTEGVARMNQRVQRIAQDRRWLEIQLRRLPFTEIIYRSEANFLLVKFTDSARVFQTLRKSKIIVRSRESDALTPGCLRITVGEQKENIRLLQSLGELL
jgi:histidinol-phosphate aminotransferase